MLAMPNDDIVSTGEGAAIAQVSPETLRRWADTGKVPSIRTLGGQRRFRRSDLERLARFTDEASA